MAWILVPALACALMLYLARRRRRRFTVSTSDSISTIHVEMSKKQTAKTRAALDAATSVLR